MNWFRNFKIRNKLLLVSGVFALFVAAVSGWAVVYILEGKDTQVEMFEGLRTRIDEYMGLAAEVCAEQVGEHVGEQAETTSDNLQYSVRIQNKRGLVLGFTNKQENAAKANARALAAAVAAFACILLAFSLFRDLFIANFIMSPLRSINKSISEIEKGNHSYPIRLPHKDELGMLSNHIGDMVDKISDINKSIAVIDNLKVIVYVTDFNYNVIFANAHCIKLLGLYRASYEGRKCYEILSGDSEPCPFCPLPELFPKKDQSPATEWERPLTVRDGDAEVDAWFACRSSIVRWTDGSLALFNAYTDETIRKQHADQLFDSAKLAEDASRIKSSFLANMSHEIRTPMNSVIGFSDLALETPGLPAQTRTFLENIKNSSEGLLAIINDILDISKIEAGKIVLESIPFDLHDVFKVCQSIIEPKAFVKGIELFVYSEPPVGKRLVGDPTRLRQCILNLLTNSVKFTNDGTVKLLSSVKSETDTHAVIHIEVKDSGIGMTEEQLEKVFAPFTQADNSTTRKYGGTGLGLTITKSFIELMGGSLKVESVAGIGTKFHFDIEFPTCEAEAGADAGGKDDPAMEKPFFGGAEILVCEDNDMNQMVISEHLSRMGIQTTIAKNGKIGVECVASRMVNAEKPFDLIFMDIHMPVMDGLEAVQKLREMGNATPVVALTANVMTTDQELYIERGMREYLPKPFAAHELWSCLLRYIKPVEKPGGDDLHISGVKARGALAQTHDDDAAADEKLRMRLITNFLKGNQNKAQEIKMACESDDIKFAHRLAHTLKGVAAMVGQNDLHGASHAVERLLENGDVENALKQLPKLEAELKKSIAELSAVKRAADSGKPKIVEADAPVDTLAALALIERLRPLLECGDGDCLELIRGLSSVPEAEDLIVQVEDYDFELALATLEEIRRKLAGE